MIPLHYDVRLLSASYRQVGGDSLVVEMFGKTRDGRSITILHYGFEPYFHVVEPTEEVIAELERDPEVRRVERRTLLYKGKERDVAQVVIRWPWMVPEYRNRLRKRFEILAADIPFHHRFIYDNDIASCIRVTGEEVKGEYATDLVVRMDGFENIEPFSPQLKVLSFDVENSIKHDTIYCICYTILDQDGMRGGDPIYGDERDIIEHFGEVIRSEDPDVITGYNIDNYDIPKVMDRAAAVGIKELRWGRDNGDPRQVMNRFWRIKGRLVADAWWAAKMELRPKQETLNAVAKLVLGEEKLDVDPKRMDEEWASDRDKVMLYCSKDAELSLRILEAVEVIRKNMDLAAVSKLPVEDVLTSGSSQLIDSILIREADRHDVGVPLTGRYTRTDAIEGGYVHTIDPGLYHWVCVLDFKSMYPSLIISKNICFTTLSEDGEIVSPTGARFMSKERREGLLPRILDDLMKERDDIKRRMKAASTEDEYRYYDGLQAAVKILMNSFYGVFASSFYRFTDKNIGSSITAFARETVKGIISELEKEGRTIIYSDTDSVFIQSPVQELGGSVAFGKEMAERYSREGGMLEFEKVFEPLFSHGKKKRYVGKVAWPEEEIVIRGYEVRRTDSFDLQSEVLEQVFEHILTEDNEGAVALARGVVTDTINGDVPIEKLVISRTCKEFNTYKDPDRQANVQAARKIIDLGYEFIPGMKVSWIVTNSNKVPQEVEPYISGRGFTATPDYRYYAERVAHTVSRATEVFGWDEKSLMTGSQQFTLFDTNFEAPSKKKERRAQEPKKRNMSLEDFF